MADQIAALLEPLVPRRVPVTLTVYDLGSGSTGKKIGVANKISGPPPGAPTATATATATASASPQRVTPPPDWRAGW